MAFRLSALAAVLILAGCCLTDVSGIGGETTTSGQIAVTGSESTGDSAASTGGTGQGTTGSTGGRNTTGGTSSSSGSAGTSGAGTTTGGTVTDTVTSMAVAPNADGGLFLAVSSPAQIAVYLVGCR